MSCPRDSPGGGLWPCTPGPGQQPCPLEARRIQALKCLWSYSSFISSCPSQSILTGLLLVQNSQKKKSPFDLPCNSWGSKASNRGSPTSLSWSLRRRFSGFPGHMPGLCNKQLCSHILLSHCQVLEIRTSADGFGGGHNSTYNT